MQKETKTNDQHGDIKKDESSGDDGEIRANHPSQVAVLY
jgi:hypothetical protein